MEWLSTGNIGHRLEYDFKYAKSSVMEDHKHVLKSVDKSLEGEITWPDAAERQRHSADYTGICQDVVGK